MSKICIVGLGHIGMSILQAFAQAEVDVLGIETNQSSIDHGLEKVRSNLDMLVNKGKIDAAKKDAILSGMKTSMDIKDAGNAEIIIEAIFEDMEIKKNFFKLLNGIVSKDGIILSNTSSLSITEMASVVDNPERFAGMHFFNPVPVMKLVEVIRGLQSSDETIEAAKKLSVDIGKTPIVCQDSPAFVVNRMLNALTKEAVLILEEGVATAEDIDTGVKLGLGHPMGPLELFDYLGANHLLDKVLSYMAEELDPKFKSPLLLRKMVKAGWWGKEYGRGFYEYPE